MNFRKRSLGLALCAVAACKIAEPERLPPDPATTTTGTTTVQRETPSNVLIFVIDDVGRDKVTSYYPEFADQLSPQPTLDGLAATGMRFDNAYAQPVCSPTRAEILTGRHSRRYGLGRFIPGDTQYEVPLKETMIPEVLTALAPDSWSTAAIGKWHLAGDNSPSAKLHPNLQGFDHYSGVPGNVNHDADWSGTTKWVDGEPERTGNYLTSDTIDDALAWVEEAPEPWFLFVATQAVHTPLHVPPNDLHSVRLAESDWTVVDQHDAMLEAVDTELGRLLDGLGPDMLANTNVVVLGDNGTYRPVIEPPFDPFRDKGSMYEGGVRVPFFVSGPAVSQPGSVSSAMVSVLDLLPTVAELAGIDAAELDDLIDGPLDGESLVGVLDDPQAETNRSYLYADRFEPLGEPPYSIMDRKTIRDQRWKLIVDEMGPAFFDMTAGEYDEGEALAMDALTAEQQQALTDLETALASKEAELVFSGDPQSP